MIFQKKPKDIPLLYRFDFQNFLHQKIEILHVAPMRHDNLLDARKLKMHKIFIKYVSL